MEDPPFEPRVRKFAVELFAPDPPPPPEVKVDKAWIDIGRVGIWGTHGSDKLTRLILLAHKYRLYAQIQLSDNALRLLILPRNATAGDPAHHPGLGDLVARAYAVAGKAAPQAHLQLAEARQHIESLLSITEVFAPPDDLSEQEAQYLQDAKRFLERTRP